MKFLNMHKINNNYLHFYKFNIFYMLYSKLFIILSIIYFIFPLMFNLISFFLDTSALSISWIYLMINGIFCLLFINIFVYELFVQSKTNTIDLFFNSKGAKKIGMWFVKNLSFFTIFIINALICSFVEIISLLIFKQANLVGSFFLMTFFGSILVCLMLFPLFTLFSMLKNKILYICLSFSFVLLPFVSVVDRINKNYLNNYIYRRDFYNYIQYYNLETHDESIFYTNNFLFKSVNVEPWYNFTPAEIMFSPLYYTYQVNLKNLNTQTPINNFTSSINIVTYNETSNNNSNAVTTDNALLLRALDENIFKYKGNAFKDKVVDAFSQLYDNLCDAGLTEFSKYARWNESDFNVSNFDKVLNIMFFDTSPNIYYIYRMVWLSLNDSSNEIYAQYSGNIQSIIDNSLPSDIPSTFTNFIKSSIIANGTNGILNILDSSDISYQINEYYPNGAVDNNAPVKSADIEKFNACFSENMFNTNSIKLIDNEGIISEFTINLVEIMSTLANSHSSIFSDADINSVISKFFNENVSISKDISEWSNRDFKAWNKYLARNYSNFNIYLNEIKRNVPQNSNTRIAQFQLSDNSPVINYSSSGELVMSTPFNILFSSLIMLSFSLLMYLCIIYLLSTKK